MKAREALTMTIAAPAVLSRQKNFSANPVLGSESFNARGLHRWRVDRAHAMSRRRREGLAANVDAAEREAFERDGYVVRENALPQPLFEAFTAELKEQRRKAWEMVQGDTATRLMPLPVSDGSAGAKVRAYLRSPSFRNLTGYVAGRSGGYNPVLQTVAVQPDPSRPDPQVTLHADTFHPTAKFWLFLHDVGIEDGPFAFVPGSHRLTPQRLAWEHEQALKATGVGNEHHAAGSFRMTEEELEALGYDRPIQPLPVKANTFLVADTYGFHRRTPALKPNARVAIHGMLRRNPFLPWNGADPSEIPGVDGRLIWLLFASRDAKARMGKPDKYRSVGLKLAGDPSIG
ncbi:phytanoyl-CoA dioxygenase family protein [Acuticoccus sp. I52.16.1]|uniref:phytanoyl-CoA dioxygenase family protein n=1 Tax=Acuticoccus sp. I52.16.1 TaxID=2928472 RepID=UPI001FD630D0|nr:phytanoyl-CoA dioxygenase family protein [Acuticoccus sp. I52.16.1]UOM35305.1 phytanoyl-CoA dioxygenase family protein [Acuticoccus sp. I52.16.1]